jgi:hypothetical protein
MPIGGPSGEFCEIRAIREGTRIEGAGDNQACTNDLERTDGRLFDDARHGRRAAER